MSEALNPFEPPESDWEPPESEPGAAENARLSLRFTAALFDGLFLWVVGTPITQWTLGQLARTREYFSDFGSMGAMFATSAAVWLGIHGYFLRNGQTLGKRLVGIQIVNASDGRPAPFLKIVFARTFFVSLLAMIPFVGPILPVVDGLFIFTRSRRCLHDHIAGTRVVKWKTPRARRRAARLRSLAEDRSPE